MGAEFTSRGPWIRLVRLGFFTGMMMLAAQGTIQAVYEKRAAPVPPDQVERFDKGDKYAVVVGIGSYPELSGLSMLKYAAADAEAASEELRRQGYEVKLLTDAQATRGSILAALSAAAVAVEAERGTILFFFSGHGFADERTKVNYVAAYETFVSDLTRTGLKLSEVLDLVEESTAKRKVLLLDACRNNPGRDAKSAGLRSLAAFEQSEGTAILYSTRFGGVSYESDDLRSGLFTHFVLRGLRGEAAGDDGFVTFRDLARFTEDGVKRWAFAKGWSQVPFDAGEKTGDFLLARVAEWPARSNSNIVRVEAVKELASIEDSWEGAIDLPGQSLEIKVGLTVTDGIWTGDISIPTQKAVDLPLTNISIDDERALFEILDVPGRPTFDGTFSDDRNSISGDFTQGGGTFPFKLTLIVPAGVTPGVERLPSGLRWEGAKIVREADGMEMKQIPAGTFWMGSETGSLDEKPVHRVRLTKAFLIDRHEVTVGQYREVMGVQPQGQIGGLNTPVVMVDWYEAKNYCETVGGRLPTEAEWEFAARGGLEDKQYPWGNEEVCAGGTCRANASGAEDGFKRTAPVCSFEENGYGLCDVAGNVWEWVGDRYGSYSRGEVADPNGPSKGPLRVFRGGSWGGGTLPGVAPRLPDLPVEPLGSRGFRCARDY